MQVYHADTFAPLGKLWNHQERLRRKLNASDAGNLVSLQNGSGVRGVRVGSRGEGPYLIYGRKGIPVLVFRNEPGGNIKALVRLLRGVYDPKPGSKPGSPPKPGSKPGSTSNSRSRHTHPVLAMTYNVSHEAMQGRTQGSAAALGKICRATAASGRNLCYLNVLYTITSKPYSFVGLQENDDDLVRDAVETLTARHQMQYAEVLGKHVAIIYNSDDFAPIGSAVEGLIRRKSDLKEVRGRPFVAQLFRFRNGTKPIAVINMHCPQPTDDYGLGDNVSLILTRLQPNVPIARVVLMGDFNKEHLFPFNAQGLTFSPAIKTRKHATGYDVTGGRRVRYTKVSDNIMVAGGSFLRKETWNTKPPRSLLPNDPSPITSKAFPALTSDHSPVAAALVFAC